MAKIRNGTLWQHTSYAPLVGCALLRELPYIGIAVYLCGMRKLSMEELQRKSVEEYRRSSKSNLHIILDNVRSMHNVGSVFRSADAFLISSISLCGYTPVPPHRDIHKTALGATETVSWQYFNSTIEAVNTAKQNGVAIWAVEQAVGSISLVDLLPEKMLPDTQAGNIAVVLGNEVEGVSDDVLSLCDGCIEIPQYGSKHSLNISVAAGIILWHLTYLFSLHNNRKA